MHVFTGICLGLAMITAAVAQTTPKPDGAWRGSLGVSFSSASGNNESASVSLNADAVRQTDRDKWVYYVQSLYSRRSVDGVNQLAAGLFRAGGRYDHDISEWTYGFGGLEVEKNKLADLKWRVSPSAGLGYHVTKTESFTFDVFGGYSYNREELYSGPSRSFDEGLLGEETTHQFTESTSFRQRLSGYPNLTDSGEYRLVFDASFLAPLVERWNLTVNLSARYQSNPPPGVQNDDTLLFTGLQYRWGPR